VRFDRTALVATAVALAAVVATPHAQVTYGRLVRAAAEPQNWLHYWGDLQGTHFSPLKSITPANVAQFLNYKLDVFVVGFFAGTASVGRYTLAVSLAQLLWLMSNSVASVLLPKVAASTASSDDGGSPARPAKPRPGDRVAGRVGGRKRGPG